jgi:bifunctional UDP-N-acetylglucosamine pyrophosphorylase/glucosamine-1-phosphate N-acetyltransferase
MKVTSVIMAAGHGKRMKSNLPKVMHPILGVPLIGYALRAAQSATSETPVVIVGHGKELVREAVAGQARCVEQTRLLGTADAVRAAEPLLRGRTDLVLITNGDMPLVRAETLRSLIELQRTNAGPLSLLTVTGPDSRGYGRVMRNADGSVREIVEEAQATPEQLAVQEYNVSAYCVVSDWLWPALARVPLSPKGEYYLTDIVGLAVQDGLPVQAVQLGDPIDAIGINTRVHLAEATAAMRDRINHAWMEAGVTLIDPRATYIEPGVKIGADCTIWPNTHLRGSTQLGESCVIGKKTLPWN